MGILRFPVNPKRNNDQRSLYVFLSVVTLFAPIVSCFCPQWLGLENSSFVCAAIGTNALADNNNDSKVDIQDFARMASRWERFSDKYDITGDNYVDLADIVVFADNWLSVFAGYSGGDNKLQSINDPNAPTRLAFAPDGRLFVTDPRTCSVFIYDPNMADPNLLVVGELKGLDKPLGIAVDSAGFIYVGNDGRNNVEIFNPSGNRIRTIGDGFIQMPNVIKIGPDDNIYVCDSKGTAVYVYSLKGKLLRTIGSGLLSFPSSIEIATVQTSPGVFETELYVADQTHDQVKVFDLEGNFLRSFGGKVVFGWMGRFFCIQSLQMDSLGRLHVLDSAMKKVQILDPQTGAYIDDYGQEGSDPGQLKLPQDIAINGNGDVVVANNGNNRVEVIYTVSGP
jgi:DNA-binding beta-propeller fold protein YncE